MSVIYATSFTGIAEDQLLETFDANWARHPNSGGTYSGCTENGGSVYPKGASKICHYYNYGAGQIADCHVSARFVHSSGGTSVSSTTVVARANATVSSHYGARIASGKYELYKRTNGANAVLASAGHGLTIPFDVVLGVRCAGSQIHLTVNGVDTLGPITDNAFSSGFPGLYATGVRSGSNAILIDNFAVDDLGAGDTTAPALTSPAALATGATTASGSVTTDEATGTLYYLASANASESAAAVKAGSSQAVTASGEQGVSVTGLNALIGYYLHFVHRDAAGNDSTVATSAQFTTSAAGDTTVPALTGAVTFASITQTSYSASWPAGLDNVAVTGYEYQIGGMAGAWADAGSSLSANISGRTAGATETVYVRAYDAAGNRSAPAISGEVTLLSAVAGITVTEPLKNNTGTLLANLSGIRVAVLQATDLVSVYETSGMTTNASGMLSAITDAAIVTGQQYHVALKLADGGVGITGPITAS